MSNSNILLHPGYQTPSMSGFVYPFLPVFNGLAGGFIGALAVFPINTVVGRRQKDKSSTNILKIINEEGFVGLYKGFGPRGIATAFEKTLKVQTNATTLYVLQKSDYFSDIYSRIMAGALAGVAQAVVITNAMERISLIMGTYGVGEMNKRLSVTEAIHIANTTGGLWKGLIPCIMRDAPFSALYFPMYSKLLDVTDNAFLAGGLAGGMAAFTVTPADVIKTRMQTTSHNTFNLAVASIRAQGMSTFFTGAVLRAFRSSIQFALNFWVLERLNALCGANDSHR